MSALVFHNGGLAISRYTGSEEQRSPNSNSRTRVQILIGGQYVDLSMDNWIDMICFIRDLDAQSIGITRAPELP